MNFYRLHFLATVQLLGAENAGGEALQKVLRWAQGRMMGAIKELQRDPSKAGAQDVLEKAALVQMLGGDASAAMAAIENWKQVEQEG